MNIDIDTLIDAYTALKEYIPIKERQGAADSLMSALVDSLGDLDRKQLIGVDSYLKRSYEEYADEDEDNEDDTYDYEN